LFEEPSVTAKLGRCFRCGTGEIDQRIVEELVRRGRYVVAIRLSAEVCSNCGERYFEGEDVAMIEDVRVRLERGELDGFRITGELLELVGEAH
jgi:YgiT-type zinc finger domain-containing protein